MQNLKIDIRPLMLCTQMRPISFDRFIFGGDCVMALAKALNAFVRTQDMLKILN